jgi:hypothetical protein
VSFLSFVNATVSSTHGPEQVPGFKGTLLFQPAVCGDLDLAENRQL